MVGDSVYFVNRDFKVVRMDLQLLHRSVAAGSFTGEEETEVADDVRLICSDGSRVTAIAASSQTVYDLFNPSIRLDLQQARKD